MEVEYFETVGNVRKEYKFGMESSLVKTKSLANGDLRHNFLEKEMSKNLVEESMDEDYFRNETLPLISSVYETENGILDDSDSKTSSSVSSKEIYDLEDIYQPNGSDFLNPDNFVIEDKTDSVSRKYLKVQCLQSIEDLEKICESEGLKLSTCTGAYYEVEMIMDDQQDKHAGKYYFVKWKNFSTKFNTWEPLKNLKKCKALINYYEAMKSTKTIVNKKLLEHFVLDIAKKPYDILTLTKLYAMISDCSENHVKSLNLNVRELRAKVREISEYSSNKLSKISAKLLGIMRFFEARKKVLVQLAEWETDINALNPSAYVKVENNADLEGPPTDFQFIHDYVNKTNCIAEEPITFCSCDNCYENRRFCCPHHSDGQFSYSRHGRLNIPSGYPIYECNKRCKCGSDCLNRVVQHGQKIKVVIFRTSNGCGWGLKTLESIRKGQFVLEYLGEIITSETAEARGSVYDYIGRSYLFDLDFGVDNCCFTVDAGHMGNVSHFINHSCDPNLHVFAVWINQPNPYLPRLAFFAKRDIKRGEELTFDYQIVKNPDRFGSSSAPEEKRILCKCNSKICRKYLF